ncbi:DinB family protein [Streptomyces sp. WMMC500]|uniref:DinB family protein n=1 Tax=Streptomyces sp. WMMC500 TaxID=3015154 RepID=UPI00248AECA6|nr:DinB family protein [Streptomyces sp. WMMC500]WBB58056.1 DinB family protein [Streptomyces sp. WMMC500]
MADTDPKADLHRSLQMARDALLWKLEGLSEYDVRRPLTPTATNLLGLVKHLSGCEIVYFGATFGRPFGEFVPWLDGPGADVPDVDMWATADESRESVVGLYRRACAHADDTIAAFALDDLGRVPHWPDDRAEVTLHRIFVHMLADTHRHAGHADIVRELIDGAAGLRRGNSGVTSRDRARWESHRRGVEDAAREAQGRESTTWP